MREGKGDESADADADADADARPVPLLRFKAPRWSAGVRASYRVPGLCCTRVPVAHALTKRWIGGAGGRTSAPQERERPKGLFRVRFACTRVAVAELELSLVVGGGVCV